MENHLAKLEALESRYRELEALMTQEEVLANPEKLTELAREQTRLEGIVQKYREYKSLTRELEDTRQMLEEGNLDHELEALARGELKKLREKQESLARELKLALLPRDEADERDGPGGRRPASSLPTSSECTAGTPPPRDGRWR